MITKKSDFNNYWHYISELTDEIFEQNDYWEIPHDTWSVYAYGEGIKVVYIKYGGKSSSAKIEQNFNKPILSAEEEKQRFSQSLSRTKSTIFELAECNEFNYFCTFTQNADKVGNRFDLKEFRKDLAQFVRNQNRGRADKIKYLLIPEQHKNGAWHIHGLLQGLTSEDLREFSLSEKLPHKIRNQLKKGEKIYNWEKYSQKFGFFTATPIKSHIACSKYITKYITKDIIKNTLDSGAHSYFASQGLKRKTRIIRTDFEQCPLDEWTFENDYVKVAWFDNLDLFQAALSENKDSKLCSAIVEKITSLHF